MKTKLMALVPVMILGLTAIDGVQTQSAGNVVRYDPAQLKTGRP